MSSDEQSLSKYDATAVAVIFIFVVTSLRLLLLHRGQGLVVVSSSWSSRRHFHHGQRHHRSCPPHHGRGRTVQASALAECIVVVIRGRSCTRLCRCRDWGHMRHALAECPGSGGIATGFVVKIVCSAHSECLRAAVSGSSRSGLRVTKTPSQLGLHTTCGLRRRISSSCIVAVEVVGPSHTLQQ